MPEKLTIRDRFLRALKKRASIYSRRKQSQEYRFEILDGLVDDPIAKIYAAGARYGWEKRSKL